MILPQRHIIILLLFLTGYLSVSQEYIHYTKKDGLAGNYVYRMTQDNEGFIWFLTDTGISKFDGKTFRNFTTKEGLPANDIWHIRITPNNKVFYFSRSDELGYIKNDSVYRFKTSDGKMMNPNGGINQSGNNITILDFEHNYRFVDSSWQATYGNSINFKLIDRDVFFIRDSVTSRLLDIKRKELYTFKEGKNFASKYQINDSLFVHCNFSFYEIVNLNTLEIIYGDVSSLEAVPLKYGGHRFNWVNDQLQLSGENWLICFDDNLEQETVYNIPKYLKSTYNFKDKDGFIWLATSGDGVYKLPIGYQNSSSFFKGKKVTKIKEIEGFIYVGIEGEGIYKFIDYKPKLWIKENSDLWGITKIEDVLFFNFRDQLHIEKNSALKKAKSFAKQFLKYNKDFFTVGSSRMASFNENIEKIKEYKDHPYYQGIFKQNDTLFSFSYKQMLYYDVEKNQFSDYKKEQIQKKLLTSTTYKGQTYIGTEGDGLYVFRQGKLSKLIANDQAVINKISIESSKSIWTVSEGVILHYTKNIVEGFSVKKYNQINGFTTNNVNDVYINNGKLYIGSSTGLTIINKDEISNNINFTPYIKSIFANEKRQVKDSLAIRYDKNLNLKINFGAINYFDDKNTTFHYQLSPLQKQWISTESGEINLFNLRPNEYILYLKATHNDMVKIIDIPINILPLWWQTSWFIIAVLLISIILIAFTFWYIEKRIRLKKNKKLILEKQMAHVELKALRSQMNPHFVHNSLNAIQYYIQRNEVELSEDYLAKFSKLIRLFFEYSRKQNITIENEISLLSNYLEIEKLRFEDKLAFNILVDEKLELEQLFPSMILQPIVENAVNHGLFHKNKKGVIGIKFMYVNDETFQVVIEDDGIGINKAKKMNKYTSKKDQSRSSEVIQERIDLLRQSNKWDINYQIEDLSDITNTTGTRVTLTYKQLESL